MQIFDNFISFRRRESLEEASEIYHSLNNKGFSTFCDIFSLNYRKNEDKVLGIIENCTNYILVLNKHSLDRCSEIDDPLRHEIAIAIEKKKNIICVLMKNTQLPEVLPKDIEGIRYCKKLIYSHKNYNGFIERLVSLFLKQSTEEASKDICQDFIIRDKVVIRYTGNAAKVIIPEHVTVIGKNAFKDKTSITEIILPDGIEQIEENSFERCIKLSRISMSSSLTHIHAGAFRRCYNLMYVKLNNELRQIGEEAFSFCMKLRSVNIGPNVSSIAADAFNNCNRLMKFSVDEANNEYSSIEGVLYNKNKTRIVRCPEGINRSIVTIHKSVEEIGAWCFSNCTGLVNIVLPAHLKRVKEYAFCDCHNINRLTMGDEIVEFDESAINGWNSNQRVVVSRRFNPQIKYMIDQKLQEEHKADQNRGDNNFPDYIMIKTTFESQEEASDMAKLLVHNKYVAAAHLTRLNVYYLWNNEECNESETELSCITRGELYHTVESFILAHHSFNCCQIICLPIISTTKDFGAWIDELTL